MTKGGGQEESEKSEEEMKDLGHLKAPVEAGLLLLHLHTLEELLHVAVGQELGDHAEVAGLSAGAHEEHNVGVEDLAGEYEGGDEALGRGRGRNLMMATSWRRSASSRGVKF